MSDDRLQRARAALERAMSARPHLDGHALTEATTCVCQYRDDLRKAVRSDPGDSGGRDRLAAANLAVTLLMAGHYPLGETPWAQMEQLGGLLDRMAAREAA
jgi:hypothetical protein